MPQRGFTLIELMVTVSIIGVLATIAVPQFISNRGRALDTRAKTDLRNVAVAEEAYYADFERYVECDQSNCLTLLPAIQGLPSPGVILQITLSSPTATSFIGTSRHTSSTKVFVWDSLNGGLQP
jgi:type IV pilus assembly protein PilA